MSPPSAGFSILITSAPRSPSSMLPNGPAPYCSTAMMRTPESGSMCSPLRRGLADAVDHRTRVCGAIEPEHRLLHLRGLTRREAHARVAGELLDDLGIRQRPVGAAAVHRLAMHQHAAVAQRDLHVAGVVAREGRARVDLVIDQVAHAQ